jgi:hypothetical protein
MTQTLARELRPAPIRVPHILQGHLDSDCSVPRAGPDGVSLLTPELNLDRMVWSRAQGFPAAQLTLNEVLDFLAAAGEALAQDRAGYVLDALENVALVNPLGRGGQGRSHMLNAVSLFDRDLMAFEYEQALGHQGDGWTTSEAPDGTRFQKRWFPTRTMHILAGNTPHGGPLAIIRSALIRGVALIKLPSNDPFTTVAVLRTMRDLDPTHPLVQCFSAVYWRGGLADVESVLIRPQFFDKIVAWGGEAAIKNVVKYLGPGLELISFDPKTSISVIDTDAFSNSAELARVADLAAADVRYQEGCGTSRHQYVRGTAEQVDAYCAELLRSMHDFHLRVGGSCNAPPRDLIEEVEALRLLEPEYRVWGAYDGTGLIVRSIEPVDFYPDGRTVNVVHLQSLSDVAQHVNAATQTVGVYPPERKDELRDLLAGGGVDRIADLGAASAGGTGALGSPHDGMVALHRFVRWIYCAV